MVTKTSELPPSAYLRRTTQLPEDPHKDVDPNQYDEPAGPIRVNPNQYPTPASPNAQDWDAQQRKAADEKFKEEQEEWNRQQSQKRRFEKYESEQEEIQESKKEKSFGQKLKSAVKEKYTKYQSEREEERQARREGKLAALRKGPAPKQPPAEKKGKQTRGQFKAPTSGNFADPFPSGGGAKPFPNIDPFGGMGGGRNAAALPSAGANMFSLGFAAKPQPPKPQRRTPLSPPSAAPSPIRFPDPFAGIKKGAGRGSKTKPAFADPYAGLPGKRGPGMYKGSDKTAVKKKFRKMDDWFKF